MLNSVEVKHFVLVHGAIHGAWCWYKVATLLKSEGHKVTTLDMAACGANPKKMEEINSISEYCEPLMQFLDSLLPEEKVILVGHSHGGLCISLAMERFPQKISVAVFISANVSENLTYQAFVEERRRRLGSVLEKQYFILDESNGVPKLSPLGVDYLASKMYQLSPDEDLTLALSLVRPLPVFGRDIELLRNQTSVTRENNGRVSKIYVICRKDNLITEDFQKWSIEATGPYAEVKVINDSDHMSMFSQPKQLTSQLLEIATTY